MSNHLEVADLMAENARLRAALKPFAAEKMPALRRTKIDYDRHGLRRCISPMEIACRNAIRALSSSENTQNIEQERQ